MEEFSLKGAGAVVGLEIHQQLATGRKLFCGCAPVETDEHTITFSRRLRASRGELGELDPAALFEGARPGAVLYFADPQSSCLVERDEEPPHGLDRESKEIALVIARALKSSVFGEIFPMRKTVVDGSNTSGFQRTMLVSRGGEYQAGGGRIGVQSVCLEEDAARILGGGGGGEARRYGLGRLGIPLVEIATEPFEAAPGRTRDAALALGRILRSTRRVRRGIGSIRQDVNVSIRGGGGAVVEVKGVQQLDQLEKVVEHEARRQHGLLEISEELRGRGWSHDRDGDRFDVTGAMGGCGSKIIQGAIKKRHRILAVAFRNLAGVFGMSPHEGVRLGRDIAELVRALGIGGVFHSDELPGYGIDARDTDEVREITGAGEADAYMILAAPQGRIHAVADQIISRVCRIRDCGVPADTRTASQSGETRFLRPRPGAARMYPETDVPPVTVSADDLARAQEGVPKPWDEAVAEIRDGYGLNAQLAEQIFDSEYMEAFERICGSTKNPPNFVASALCSTITGLARGGLDRARLSQDAILRVFTLLHEGAIPKESVEMIFGEIMSGRSPDEAMRGSGSAALSDAELGAALDRIVGGNGPMIERMGERATGPLMGAAMKELRGRAPGEKISRLLSEKVKRACNKK